MKTLEISKYLIIIIVFVFASCSSTQTTEDTDSKDTSILVRTSTSVIQKVEQEVDFTGNVEAFRQNHISSSTPSRIEKIYVEVGDMVKKGQLLVQMDKTMFAQMSVQLNNLEKEYARLDTLYRVGSVPQQQVDQVKTQLDVLRTSFLSSTENTQLRSPIDGIITGRYLNDGEMYTMTPSLTGKPAIVSVMQIQPVKVLVNVPEMYFPRVRLGMETTIKLDIYPDKEFNGKVYLIHPTIEPMTRTFTVEVEIPNPQMLIRPGMFARVKFGFGEMDRVMVPDLAVQRQTGTNERYVFVVEDGIAIRKTVSIGRRINDSFEILSGLIPNE
ncbi:MAG: efflux RND transporter periplasmic adaptor subunit, partial [Bacteroidetes bacterium HGW-Bacteroidetes-15]